MDFKIKMQEFKDDFMECYKFYAVDLNGKEIFGTTVDVRRDKFFDIKEWEEFTISFGSCGAQTYKDKLPKITAINVAMERLKKLKEA